MLREDQKYARVALRLWAHSLPLDDLAELLGLPGKPVGRNGEFIGGQPHRARHDRDSWIWNMPTDPSLPLEDQLGLALDSIEPRRAEVERILVETGGEADLFLGYSSGNGQGGAYFSAALLGRLGALSIPILLDLYPPTAEDLRYGSTMDQI